MKETQTVNTNKTQPDYKYPNPDQPSFVAEVKKYVATAEPPNFSQQAKPRGRKSQVCKAIAGEIGEDEKGDDGDGDGEKPPPKRKRKATPVTVRAPRTRKTVAKKDKGKETGKGSRSKAKGSKESTAKSKRGNQKTNTNKRNEKPRTSRAIRMPATHPGPIAAAQVSKDVPKDAEPAPPHITSNNVYSNAYRKALAGNKGDTEAARATAREASALFSKHRMVRSEWTGVFRPKKTKS